MIISAKFPAVPVAAVVALSLMGSAATAAIYQAIPINVSFEFAPTPGTILTADTGNLSATTTSITAIADAFDLYTVFSA